MITGRPRKPLTLSEEEHEQLSAIVNSRSLPHGLVRRARIVLMASEGMTNCAIAERVSLSPQMVCKWRQRYLQQGLSGFHDEFVLVSLDQFQMKKLPCLFVKPFKPNLVRFIN